MNVHIGRKVHNEVRRQGLSISEFAKLIGYSKNSVCKMFTKPSLQTELVHKMSIGLKRDFFQYLSDEINTTLGIPATNTDKENEELKKEIIFLKEIIQALKNK